MGKRFSAGVLGGLAAAALSAAACGLGFSDIELGAGPAPTPSGTGPLDGTSPTPTTPPTVPTPEADAATDGDALANLDAGANFDAADARPPATTARPAFVFRFELNGICGILPTVYCTRNDGTFGPAGLYRGTAAELGGAPNVPGASTNWWKARNSGTEYVEVENVGDVVPAGGADKLTVAVWVRRTGDARRDTRIVSLGPKSGSGAAGEPVFELGFKADNDTKLMLSINEKLNDGELTTAKDHINVNEWTFVAVTFDNALATNQACFYRGTEGKAVELIECRNYNGSSALRRAAGSRLAIGGPANDRERNNDHSFPGSIDNVYVYVGDVLDLTELEKLRTD